MDAACHRVGARYYTIGAQAVILHGYERFTNDVDVAVAFDGPGDALVAALTNAGLDLLVADGARFLREARVLPLRHGRTRLLVDVVLIGPGLEEDFLARTVERIVDGARIPVVRPEDLVAMKLLAGRPKDIEDVVGVMAAQRASFDVKMVRVTLRLLERALDRSDLAPLFDEALRRAGLKKGAAPRKRPAGKKH